MELGRGGAGVVWKARQTNLGRDVALKLLAAGSLALDAEKGRLRREAEAMARLKHPGIVTVHEVGEIDGHLYLAMELISGGSLADRLRASPLTCRAAGQLIRDAAEAIAHAHDRGVIHRDLKPANILLDELGAPHVADFGIAKFFTPLHGGPSLPSLPPTPFDLTVTGQNLGTVHYLAPEQATGSPRSVGPSVDIHALGAVLYQCITGRPPFLGDSFAETLRQVTDVDPPAPRLLNPSVPRDLETICLKCLSKSPSDRYSTAREISEDLDRWLEGRPITARSISAFERWMKLARRKPLITGLISALVGVLLMASAVTHWQSGKVRQANMELRRRQAQQVAELATTDLDRGDHQLGICRLAREIREDGESGFAARRLVSLIQEECWLLPRLVLGPQTKSAIAVKFSHDRKRLVVASEDPGGGGFVLLSLWDAAENSSVPTSPVAQWRAPWARVSGIVFSADDALIGLCSPEGETVVFSKEGRIVAAPVGLTNICSTSVVVRDCPSPDGSRILRVPMNATSLKTVTLIDATTERTLKEYQGEESGSDSKWKMTQRGLMFVTMNGASLRIREAVGGELAMKEFDCGGVIEDVAWSEDAEMLAIAALDKPVVLYEMRWGRTPIAMTKLPSGVKALQWSLDGRQIAVVQNANQISLVERSPGEGNLGHKSRSIEGTAVAMLPDGKGMAVGGQDGRVQRVNMSDLNTDYSYATMPGTVTHLLVSPDGKWLASIAGHRWIQILEVNPGAEKSVLVDLHEFGTDGFISDQLFQVVFSPDSKSLAVASSRNVAAVWSVPDLKLRFAKVSSGPFACIAFSPNNLWVAAGNMNGKCFIADAKSWAVISEDFVHLNEVLGISFSEDSGSMITVGRDGHIRRWSAPQGKLVLDFLAQDNSVRSIMSVRDGQVLITGSLEGMVRRYDAQWGLSLGNPIRLGVGVIRGFELDPTGKFLAIGERSGGFAILDLWPSEIHLPGWFVPLSEALAGKQMLESGGIRTISEEEFVKLRIHLSSLPESDQDWDSLRKRFAMNH